MFCYSGLTEEQVGQLREKHHIYLTKDGRISMAGINSDNVEYIAKAIVDVTKD
jgi:aspartate aminotransferase, mitochondrial